MPLLLSRAHAGEPFRPTQDDLGNVGVGFDVIVVGGFAPQALDRRERRAGAWFAALAFDRSHQGSFLAAHKGAGAHADFQVEGKIAAEDIFTQQAKVARLLDGNIQGFHGDGVFGPAVNVAL